MKPLINIIRTILVAGIVLSNNTVYSQDKLELSGGVGMPDCKSRKP
jgi:hypothetical protein